MKDGIHVFWLRNGHRHPVTCVAAKKEGSTVKYAVATHNPHDKFNRVTGRNKAIGRLNAVKNPPASIQVPDGCDPKRLLLESIANNESYGPLTRSLAHSALAEINLRGKAQ